MVVLSKVEEEGRARRESREGEQGRFQAVARAA